MTSTLPPRLADRGFRVTARPTADPYYQTDAHRRWSRAVIARADYRCEDPQHDPAKPRSGIRLVADHIIERKDGGDNSVENGMARCMACHSRKTLAEAARRAFAAPDVR